LNLQTFEFSNNEKSVFGYIRWIPKFVSNTENNDQKLVHIDNYHPIAGIQPIPLTTKRLKKVSQMKKTGQQQTNDLAYQEDDDEGGLEIATIFDEGDNDVGDDDDSGYSNRNNKVG